MKKKYLNIYDELVNKINLKVWPSGTMLPSENELTAEYRASRETIRKVLTLLSQNGYIQKIHGKGSVVLDVHHFSFPVSGIASFKELAETMDVPYRTIVQKLCRIDPHSDVHQLLNTGGDTVWQVNRVREIDREHIILDKDYFNESFIPMLSEDICTDSIYEYIENHLGLSISFAEKEIVVEPPAQEDQELLDLEGFSNIVVITSRVYLADASLFQYTESRHRPDKFRFVDFARRF